MLGWSVYAGACHPTNSVLCWVSLVMMAKEKPPITVVGDVGGRIAIIVVRAMRHASSCSCTEVTPLAVSVGLVMADFSGSTCLPLLSLH